MSSNDQKDQYYIRTPLIHSKPLTNLLSTSLPSQKKQKKYPVYLKLDNLQPSGSFKDRGMSNLCTTLLRTKSIHHLISSSGGNAGLSVTTVGRQLGMDVTVVVPKSTKELVIDRLRKLGAEVIVHGEIWNEADLLAREMVMSGEGGGKKGYVSPYDDELLWRGHSTIVDEVLEDLEKEEMDLGVMVASVGGGGLMCGVLEGLQRHKCDNTVVLAAETEGASSFHLAYTKGIGSKLNSIDSIATSLGALEVTPVAVKRAKAHSEGKGNVDTSVCTDAEAVEACVKFATDHRILVEPACGAALASLYSERLRDEVLIPSLMMGDDDDDDDDGGEERKKAVVIEVCGGSGVDLELLERWKTQFL